MCELELRNLQAKLAQLELDTRCGVSRKGGFVLAADRPRLCDMPVESAGLVSSRVKMSDEKLRNLRAEVAQLELNTNCGVSREGSSMLAAARPRLYDMPVEIILRICSFLDADFLKLTFTKVCKRFEVILEDNHIWKFWFLSKLKGGEYPALPQLDFWKDEHIDWEQLAWETASEKRKWENVRDTMRHIVVKNIHYASVDTVLLVNNGEFCVSGGRDRGLALWRVLDVGPQTVRAGDAVSTLADAKPRRMHAHAHNGWVWDLAPDCVRNTRRVYSASWDNTVRAWDLDSDFTCVDTYQCGMSALSVETCGSVVLAGLYSKRVMLFDGRAGPSAIGTYMPHRGPVLALTSHGDLVASISEDRTLAVWDQRARKTALANVRLPTGKAYPVCVSWNRAALYVGDSRGGLHLLHPQTCELLRSSEVWPEAPPTQPASKVTGCLQVPTGLVVCSDRGEVKFMYNSSTPVEYVRVHAATLDITQMRYVNGILALGTCDAALEFWVPDHMYPDSRDAPDAPDPPAAE